MKLKRIRKVEYNLSGEPIIRIVEYHLYDVYFIDNEDWLCIDEEDYTEEKKNERQAERHRQIMKQYAEVGYTYTNSAYYVRLTFTAGDDGKVEFQ